MKMIPGYHQIPLLGQRKPKPELPFAVARRRARQKIDVDVIRAFLLSCDRAAKFDQIIKAAGINADNTRRLARVLHRLSRRGYLVDTPVYYASDTTQFGGYEGYFNVYSLPGQPVNWPYSLDPTVLPKRKAE